MPVSPKTLAHVVCRTRRNTLLTLAALLCSACAATGPAPEPSAAQTAPGLDHPSLLAILWVQSAAEYRATALSVYNSASDQLDAALADPGWNALAPDPSAAAKPPAVILDLDETVLDNSAYQARLVRDGVEFEETSWRAWCEERQAGAVPGALEFIRLAQARGVRVFYVTNRDHSVEAATADNLRKLGLMLPEGEDVLLTRGERPEWDSSKVQRRAHVAERYRVLMLFGDNLGDFTYPYREPIGARRAVVDAAQQRWGRQWFMLPNPLYGSWEAALFGHDYGLPEAARRAARERALDMRE